VDDPHRPAGAWRADPLRLPSPLAAALAILTVSGIFDCYRSPPTPRCAGHPPVPAKPGVRIVQGGNEPGTRHGHDPGRGGRRTVRAQPGHRTGGAIGAVAAIVVALTRPRASWTGGVAATPARSSRGLARQIVVAVCGLAPSVGHRVLLPAYAAVAGVRGYAPSVRSWDFSFLRVRRWRVCGLAPTVGHQDSFLRFSWSGCRLW